MPPKILTIVLNYKTPDMTRDAVAAAVREMEGIAGEIIIVDNDSQDNSFETINHASHDMMCGQMAMLDDGRLATKSLRPPRFSAV